jgi:hypothetical protein
VGIEHPGAPIASLRGAQHSRVRPGALGGDGAAIQLRRSRAPGTGATDWEGAARVKPLTKRTKLPCRSSVIDLAEPGRSGLRSAGPTAWGPRVYQATTPTAPCRAARLDRPGRTACCRFAARGGQFGDGRRRTGPLTWLELRGFEPRSLACHRGTPAGRPPRSLASQGIPLKSLF